MNVRIEMLETQRPLRLDFPDQDELPRPPYRKSFAVYEDLPVFPALRGVGYSNTVKMR